MRTRTTLVTVLLLLLGLGCDRHPIEPEAAVNVSPAPPATQSVPALVETDCVGERGAVRTVAVPVSPTAVWIADVRIESATCLTRPNGARFFHVTAQVLTDVPLPAMKVTVSPLDENGDPVVFDVFLEGEFLLATIAPCGWIDPGVDPTFDAEYSLAPSGIHHATCRWDP